jgi:ABC-type antimicrobial peptide transport system permease subunit
MAEKLLLPRQGVPAQPGNSAQTFMMIQCISDILIGILSSFFLFWGITLLLSAYSLKNPLEFIMLFFSSNFIILISGTGILYAAFRLWRIFKEKIRPS